MGLLGADGKPNTKPLEYQGKKILIKNPSQGAAS